MLHTTSPSPTWCRECKPIQRLFLVHVAAHRKDLASATDQTPSAKPATRRPLHTRNEEATLWLLPNSLFEEADMRACSFRTILVLLALSLLAGCAPRADTTRPIPMALIAAPQTAHRLVVILPGRADDLAALKEERRRAGDPGHLAGRRRTVGRTQDG